MEYETTILDLLDSELYKKVDNIIEIYKDEISKISLKEILLKMIKKKVYTLLKKILNYNNDYGDYVIYIGCTVSDIKVVKIGLEFTKKEKYTEYDYINQIHTDPIIISCINNDLNILKLLLKNYKKIDDLKQLESVCSKYKRIDIISYFIEENILFYSYEIYYKYYKLFKKLIDNNNIYKRLFCNDLQLFLEINRNEPMMKKCILNYIFNNFNPKIKEFCKLTKYDFIFSDLYENIYLIHKLNKGDVDLLNNLKKEKMIDLIFIIIILEKNKLLYEIFDNIYIMISNKLIFKYAVKYDNLELVKEYIGSLKNEFNKKSFNDYIIKCAVNTKNHKLITFIITHLKF